MTNKKFLSKIIICCALIFALLLPLSIKGIISADTETLTIDTLISEHSNQEITDNLGFSTDFGDEAEMPSSTGWTTPTYEGVTIGTPTVIDLTDNTLEIGYDEAVATDIGTDNVAGNKYGLLFVTSTAGVLGVESTEFTIPAHALYVLTFKVKIGEITSSKGINAKIISDDKTVSMTAIKTKSSSYSTYAFLISGNEISDSDVKIQILWGNVTESDEEYAAVNETGYAVVDTIRLFSVSGPQFTDLSTVSANTKVNLSLSNTDSIFINNGYFNFTNNQNWDLTELQYISDLRPSDWTQTAESTNTAHYGIVDVYSTSFISRMLELELDFINPGNANGTTNHNNVLLMYNQTSTYQTITSSQITLAKNGYYEISFNFNTPATQTSADLEDNSLSFYIIDEDENIIYESEDMFSYTEWAEDANEWATFHAFIRTKSDTAEKVNFVVKFGTEDEEQSGYAYLDEVILRTRTSATTFVNATSDYYVLNTEDETEEFLETGAVSFEDLKNLDETNINNRSLAIYDYTAAVVDPGDDTDNTDDEITDDSNGAALTYLWYVIPSILLAVCTIMGLIIFYARKFKEKIKKPKKHKKGAYDRKKTLEKQVASREKAELKSKNNLENELKNTRAQIEKLESKYDKSKSNPLFLKEYVRKREHLQNAETKLLEKISKRNNLK